MVVFKFRQDAKLDPALLLKLVERRGDLTLAAACSPEDGYVEGNDLGGRFPEDRAEENDPEVVSAHLLVDRPRYVERPRPGSRGS